MAVLTVKAPFIVYEPDATEPGEGNPLLVETLRVQKIYYFKVATGNNTLVCTSADKIKEIPLITIDQVINSSGATAIEHDVDVNTEDAVQKSIAVNINTEFQ
ncbi:MAG: hypothetical protein EKK63_02635 [Acinetobacter sp.]|uniref:hypothetical protein n=1 Tax=Acinetobacter sp. TaxID=472 RepID=UPI000FA182EC|nr:hypothetical protein [Acinetobacter sp.]RUP42214.1 MAG: hypothetical protein EKK63_02635 [Acinetobacter sp.]